MKSNWFDQDQGFQLFNLQNGCLAMYEDRLHKTIVSGFVHGGRIILPDNYTHFGIVIDGSIKIANSERVRFLEAGDFFSIKDGATVESSGKGMISSAFGYAGLNTFGGPIEDVGRLKYIDGCTDTLLVHPVKLGDPCLSFLHFPPGVTQTLHTHPTVRVGIVFCGSGICRMPDDRKKHTIF